MIPVAPREYRLVTRGTVVPGREIVEGTVARPVTLGVSRTPTPGSRLNPPNSGLAVEGVERTTSVRVEVRGVVIVVCGVLVLRVGLDVV